jgi:hypothetical protein
MGDRWGIVTLRDRVIGLVDWVIDNHPMTHSLNVTTITQSPDHQITKWLQHSLLS